MWNNKKSITISEYDIVIEILLVIILFILIISKSIMFAEFQLLNDNEIDEERKIKIMQKKMESYLRTTTWK